MILVKKTAVLSPKGAHGLSGVARFECFKDRSDVRIKLAGGHKDAYAAVAVGDEKKLFRLGADRVYLARTDLSGDCAAIVADADKRVLCAGATVCGYDFAPLEELLALGIVAAQDAAEDNEEEEARTHVKDNELAHEEETTSVKGGEEPSAAAEESSVGGKDREEEKEQTVADNAVNEQVGTSASGEEEKEVKDNIGREEKQTGRFFDKIKEKMDKLFADNEKDDELTALIPDSRWVRVRTEDEWYVVGVVGDPAEFICYGIPGDDKSDPPSEDAGCRQWLEIEKGGRGYWMMYQSAESGETLQAV